MGYTGGTQWTEELIISKILECKEALGIDYMPSANDMEFYFNDSSLKTAITRYGGIKKFQEEMNLPSKRPAKKWTEEDIVQELTYMVSLTKQKTMPTQSELAKFFNNRHLACAITRHGGYAYFSKKMNLPMKQSDTFFGEENEQICIKNIKEKTGLCGIKTVNSHPYDILVESAVKIDVKSSRIRKHKNYLYNSFTLKKKQQTCDIFVFYCYDNNDVLKKTLIIPSYVLSGRTALNVGFNHSMYDIYKDRWDLIEDYYKFITNAIIKEEKIIYG